MIRFVFLATGILNVLKSGTNTNQTDAQSIKRTESKGAFGMPGLNKEVFGEALRRLSAEGSPVIRFVRREKCTTALNPDQFFTSLVTHVKRRESKGAFD